MIETSDGNYVMFGSTTTENLTTDLSLIKINGQGEKLFGMTLGGEDNDYGRSVIETSDGGYLLFGLTHSFGAGGKDLYLTKTNNRGVKIFSRTFGGENDDWGNCVIETSDGGYLMVGCGGPEAGMYVLKIDREGKKEFRKIFGGSMWDEGRSAIETKDGGYLILGFTNSSGAGEYDMYLVKTDRKGNLLWEKTYGGALEDKGYSVIETSDGGYLMVGETSTLDTDKKDMYLVKTDRGGNMLWQKAFGGAHNDYGRSVIETSDGGYLMLGVTYSFGSGKADMYLIKTDKTGNVRGGSGSDNITDIKWDMQRAEAEED